jgi:glycosidase
MRPIVTLFILSLLAACSAPQQEETQGKEVSQLTFPERAKDMVMYEVNTRQHTAEGTFRAFIPHMERIKNMGVDILWIMPIQPVGEEKRKGGLGSYYSISDYKGINSEYGNLEDFKAVVDEAHKLGMLVILDWVGNHTAWDHQWMTSHPDFYSTDSLGNVVSPVQDWSDVADLDYNNEAMQEEMIKDMKYWVETADIDGFRCDVAGFVPMDFWNKAKDSLDQVKDLFMLAEWDEGKMHKDAFHMTYSWGMHHVMNAIAKGEMNADSIDAFLAKDKAKFQPKDFRLQFTSNHDENSWNGTVYERFGEGAKTFAVFASTIQGMPLLYGGMEAGLNKRLRFFDKDTVDWSRTPLASFYTTLFELKANNEALWNGAYGGEAKRINTEDNSQEVYAFIREKNGNQVIVILNLSADAQSVTLDEAAPKGMFKDAFAAEMELTGEAIDLAPWGYYILTNN